MFREWEAYESGVTALVHGGSEGSNMRPGDYNPWFVPFIVAIHLAIRYLIPGVIVAWIFGIGSPLWWVLIAIAGFDYVFACIRTWTNPEGSFRGSRDDLS